MGVRSISIEDACDRPEISAELDALEAACPGIEGGASAVAITFLGRSYRRPVKHASSKDVIGQAILVTFPTEDGPFTFVFEANFRLPDERQLARAGDKVPLAREVEVDVAGQRHRFNGIYFCEQNTVTTVCAHSALRTIVHAITGNRLTTSEVQQLLGQPNGGGIRDQDLAKAIEQFGRKARIYNFSRTDPSRAGGARGRKKGSATDAVRDHAGDGSADALWSILSSSIEAGHPALLIVKAEDPVSHVMPVLGYTVNTDEWHPHAASLYRGEREPFLSSSHWVDHLIINDDLGGPYYCLAQAWARGMQDAVPLGVITVMPEEADITLALAESTAYSSLKQLLSQIDEYLRPGSKWWRFLADRMDGDGYPPVLRTTLTRRTDYLEHLTASAAYMRRKLDPEIQQEFENALPASFWLCEVSLPNLYVGNGAKLGEIMIRPSPRPTSKRSSPLDLLVGFRLPSVIGWKQGSDLAVAKCDLKDHAPMIRARGIQLREGRSESTPRGRLEGRRSDNRSGS